MRKDVPEHGAARVSPLLTLPANGTHPPGETFPREAARSSARPSPRPPSARSKSTRALLLESPEPSLLASQKAPLVSLDNFETAPRLRCVLNSPRSVRACGLEGVAPSELLPRALSAFEAPNVPPALAAVRHMHYESRRKEMLQRVRAARALLPPETPRAAADSPPNANANLRSRSSSAPYRVSRARSPSPNGGLSWDGPERRSPSMSTMRIYSRALSEHRQVFLAELVALERIAERELRAEEVRERVALEQEIREAILIDRELVKARHIMGKMVQKEIQRYDNLRNRQLHWQEQLQRVRENQMREALHRRERTESLTKQRGVETWIRQQRKANAWGKSPRSVSKPHTHAIAAEETRTETEDAAAP